MVMMTVDWRAVLRVQMWAASTVELWVGYSGSYWAATMAGSSVAWWADLLVESLAVLKVVPLAVQWADLWAPCSDVQWVVLTAVLLADQMVAWSAEQREGPRVSPWVVLTVVPWAVM